VGARGGGRGFGGLRGRFSVGAWALAEASDILIDSGGLTRGLGSPEEQNIIEAVLFKEIFRKRGCAVDRGS
jgi:hypothetical protein